MAVNKNNSQVSITLSKDIVAKIDKDAAKELRTRSKQIAKIITDCYEKKENELCLLIKKKKSCTILS